MFNQFNKRMLPKLNEMARKLNGILDIRSDKYINVKRAGNGTTLSLNMREVRRGLAPSGGGGSGGPKRAACTAPAGGTNEIAATLFNSNGTTGDAVTVTCNISNGTALNAASPRLETADVIYVQSINWDDGGTPTQRWECVTNFMTTDDCRCIDDNPTFETVTITEGLDLYEDKLLTYNSDSTDNTYQTYNSATNEMELWVDGVLVTSSSAT